MAELAPSLMASVAALISAPTLALRSCTLAGELVDVSLPALFVGSSNAGTVPAGDRVISSGICSSHIR